MSGKENKRLEVLRRLADGVLSQREAGRVLGVSERQVRRLARRYAALGAAGLVSKRRGQPSHRRLDEAVKQTIVERCGTATPILARRWRRSICAARACVCRRRPCAAG